MNRGLLAGQARRAKPWVYVPFTGFYSIINNAGETSGIQVTAPLNLTGTGFGGQNLPPSGSLRALEVLVWSRNSTSAATTVTVCYDFDTSDVVGAADTGGGQVIAYSGSVINHHANGMGTVRTGGKGNSQFKYNIVGTNSQAYIRAVGAWYEVP